MNPPPRRSECLEEVVAAVQAREYFVWIYDDVSFGTDRERAVTASLKTVALYFKNDGVSEPVEVYITDEDANAQVANGAEDFRPQPHDDYRVRLLEALRQRTARTWHYEGAYVTDA